MSKETSNAEGRQSPNARSVWDLGTLKWQVCGFAPFLWGVDKCTDIHQAPDAEVGPIDAPVPGSVQKALLNAGIIPDWNVGLNAREVEWVENRDWIYQTQLPDEWLREGTRLRLRCGGLDYAGSILLNGASVLDFEGSFTPYEVDLKPHLKPSGNLLQIWFQQSPRWLGQFGHTSRMKEEKPRFNYSWDWTSRLVQIGIWDSVTLEVVREAEIGKIRCIPRLSLDSITGNLQFSATTTGGKLLEVALKDGNRVLRKQTVAVGEGAAELSWDHLPVELWWPNGLGKQTLYDLHIRLLDEQNQLIDSRMLRVGFRHIEWKRTRGAAENAHPYLCVVNGKELFLFGVNWTPILPNFADVQREDYTKRIAVYRDIGVNVLRVWGGGFPERQWLFDLCDENGFLVWQEFPLSSSGLDNYPPADETSIRRLSEVAESYIQRLQHHTSLALWCGGNELQDDLAGHVSSDPTLTIEHHPLIERLREIVQQHDPGRYFVPTSPFGPIGSFTRQTCGENKHEDVHGPWTFDGPVDGAWRDLWQHDDAMFHSEMGAPSASPAAMIRRFRGNLPAVPGTHSNPLWNRQPWWIEWPKFALEKGREPASLEEFVTWSQKRQADALTLAVSAMKSRFPACGGVILWMGHDCFPCTANTSIVDFDGEPKPAAMALKNVIRKA
ncbi:MAG TPA: glycoside hydrolase family 2 TIM barrel-domain containing protein [Acidisarcina sp.]|nr:glycoside hydrolase family 2 TIM barrel-domain containing protein [Acidisarcina sp.]